ncbi:transmembrane protein adipocyte-associated 1-like [Melia azedarach]|uniref:Transmembrane protein adipocyte-associated 1-like n=1 Tax=Melia azedarach TaxID=155640 RepID=A0ACC1XPA3_MELAZ|nr:transmembrane protein adipocyte-associated 1-like [Melia azedarach]
MAKNLEAVNNYNITLVNVTVSLPRIAELPITAKTSVGDESTGQCHGVLHDAVLVVPTVLFVLYLAVHAKKNLTKLRNGRSYIMISYYALLWLASALNLAWCSLQYWQCSAGKEVSWNLLSLFTVSAMLYLEISLVAFLLQESYASGLETLARTFIISGIIAGVDILLKVIYVFGFGFPLFIDVESTHRMKWGLWIIHKLLLTAVYGFILFVHFSKWREKLPTRPAFYHYVVVMFVVSAGGIVRLCACWNGMGFWHLVIQSHGYLLSFTLSSLLVCNFSGRFFPGGRFSSG